jgi:hypothetical protein
MPISFVPAAAPTSPAGPGASGGGDGGAMFGAVLDDVRPGSRDATDAARDDDAARDKEKDERSAEAGAGSAPPPAAGLVGPPNGDARTPAAAATGPAPARVAAVVPAATSGAASLSTMDAMEAAATAVAAGEPADRSSAGDAGAENAAGRPQDQGAAPAFAPRSDGGIGVGSTAPASQSAPAAQAPPLPPAAQVALRLAPLRVGPDGTHQLTIHLNPEGLGPISVVAEVRGDELSVRLTGTTTGADALKAALPQLEQQLRDGGFSTVAVDVREAPRLDQALRPAWAAGGATDNATFGTGTTTSAAKTEGQPIGRLDQPDGLGHRLHARPDQPGIGLYNAAGQPVGSSQTGSGQQHGAGQQSPANQLNLGQPGNQPGGNQQGHTGPFGAADHQAGGGQHGTGRNAGPEQLPGVGEREPRSADHPADHRPGIDLAVTRSVDLRV